MHRYSPLLELLALFVTIATAHFVERRPGGSPPPVHARPSPSKSRPEPSPPVDRERLAHLMGPPTGTPCTSSLNDIAMQARIVPAFRNGVAIGFKLFSIRPDSLYARLGIQNGDIVRRINGIDLNTPEKALEIYSKLKDSRAYEINLERDGKELVVFFPRPNCTG